MSEVRHQPIAPSETYTLRPGVSIDAHRHDDDQLVYAGRGLVTVTTDAGSWVAPANQAIWIPRQVIHAHQAHGELELHLVGLSNDERNISVVEPLVLSVSPLLRELIIVCSRAESRPPARHKRLIGVLRDELAVAPREQLHLPMPESRQLRRLCEILCADPADGRTLGELGRRVGTSDRTLSRMFRAELGMSFLQWRTQLRLHHALSLLAADTPVTVVAYRCGWSSPSAFIDVFRRTFGATPGSYLASRY